MNRNELIAAVALDFLRSHLEEEPDGSLRFCMMGLESSLVCSIARAVVDDADISEKITVKIPTLFDQARTLPAGTTTDESITHWRHCSLPTGKRGVLFAASQEELQRNDKSVEKVTKIETDTLRARYGAWIEQAGLTSVRLDRAKQAHLLAALESADSTHVARTIEEFADFVVSISEGIIAGGLPLQKAIDNALPALRLPRYSGYFDRIPEQKRNKTAEWKKIFRRLHTKIRPLLVKESERNEPIPRDQLRANLYDMKPRLTSDAEYEAIDSFLEADVKIDDWTPEQRALVDLDWRSISDLFEGVSKTASQPLGERTIKFFDDEFDDLLDEEERELLANVFPKEPSDDLQKFFEEHREHLARDMKLSSSWERYVYRNPQTYRDFLIGLVATIDGLRRRVRDDELKSNNLVVRIPNAREKSFWRRKNSLVARYFAFRYRGLDSLMGPDVTFDFGKLQEFYLPRPEADLDKATSRSRDARSIKFEVALDPDGANARLIFFWEMPVDAVATAFPDDILSVANWDHDHALLPTADVARQSVSAKGGIQRIDLDNVNTIRDATNSNNGKLVAPNTENGDRSGAFRQGLADLSHVIGQDERDDIASCFDEFVEAYTSTIREWAGNSGAGLASNAFERQAEKYTQLLKSLLKSANNDLGREKLWHEVLRIGVANVGAGSPAAIIMPFHPLRLAEIKAKAVQATELIKRVLNAREGDVFRADLLFAQIQLDLVSSYYPEVCIGFDNDRPILLASSDSANDYTLAEPPSRQLSTRSDASLDNEPGVAAKAFGAVGEQYLKLLPHERNNFSVVLFNAESKALPAALASELSSKVEQEDELQCDLLLTHSEPGRIRRIYEQQNAAVDDEPGSMLASDAGRNFLSRLRVGFLDAASVPENEEDRAADLVAMQDVVARNAKLVWKNAPGSRHPGLTEHIPSRWSRRRPIGLADTTSSVYLSCPAQTLAGQRYLNAVHGYLEGDNAKQGDVIPAREVNFRDGEIGDILRKTHRIGEWVVNFDEIVDRRLLTNNGIQVIRHIHDRHVDRNIIVSTTSRPRLLKVLIRERLERLDPAILSPTETVVDRVIDQANTLSGQVVMRAARYGHYANELLGVVLSMELIRFGLGAKDLPLGWYFLDDFASWFGQREEQIADIMAIAPRMEDGKPVLKIAVSEAKFVGSAGYRAHAKKSAKQLEETVARISRALEPDRKRIDREIWLHRLGDFMIEEIEPFDASLLNGWDLHRWSDEVRQDNVQIQVAGFSHVFVHDDDENVDAAGPTPLKGMPHCSQEIFDKPRVAAAYRAFSKGALANDLVTADEERWQNAFDSLPSGQSTEPDVTGEREAEEASHSLEPQRTEHDGADTQVQTGEDTTETAPEPEIVSDRARDSSETLKVAGHPDSGWPSQDLAEWVSHGRAIGDDDAESLAWLDDTVKTLQRALRGYEMTAELVGARLTPNAGLVRFRGSDDLTVPKVEKRQQELLTSHAVQVINVLAAPFEVVIMVARPTRMILRLQDLWRQRDLPETAPQSNTSLLLGARESDGELLYLNVGDGFGGLQPHGPHTLVAGETGSGKGVLVQCLLLDICATNSPEAARIQVIDPKAGIDYPWLRRMPHLDGDLITDREGAIAALESLVSEMERRNRLLADAGVNKLAHFNRKVERAEQLPRVWLFHDELADWMMIKEYRDEVELNASRLGVKARAAGINLVLVTQRPDKDALPMQLRANLTNRLVLKVADKRNSVLVLDEPGAEKLLGRGHLAARLSGEGDIILAQVPFASGDEISELAELIERAWAHPASPA